MTFPENMSIITPMIKKTKKTAAYRRVASRLKRLLGEGQVIEGSLSRVTAGSAAHWHLTRKVNGRTQTLFVAILVLGLASVPHVAVGAMRMRRFHLCALCASA